MTLLPNESKEDFIYVDTQLTLSPRNGEMIKNLEPVDSAGDSLRTPGLVDEKLNEINTNELSLKRPYEANGHLDIDKEDENSPFKKSKEFKVNDLFIVNFSDAC